MAMFQSTHPRGVRQGIARLALRQGHVSIHAPAWGATGRGHGGGRREGGFNPRTRVGCDPISTHSTDTMAAFQSTHPRGVRLHHDVALRGPVEVSIHAPAWGATLDFPVLLPEFVVSIHAPAWGATGQCRSRRAWAAMFQSTHPRGVRQQQSHQTEP